MKLNFIKISLTIFLISLTTIISLSFLNTNKANAEFEPGEPIYVDADNISGTENGSIESPYNTIQEAVDAAVNNGDNTIFVVDGIYNENINVNKNHLSILSKSGAENTIVRAKNSDDNVLKIKADYVILDGFTTEGTRYSNRAGILLTNANFCEISNNIVLDNNRGINISSSSNNILIENKILNNYSNFYLSGNSDSHFDNTINATNTVDGKSIYYI